MNETRLWHCNICGESFNSKSKPKHNKPNSHKHKEQFSVVVKECEFTRPDNDKIDYIFNNCAGVSYNKSFHTVKFRCIYDIELTFGDFVTDIISDKKLEKIARENGFLHKITIEIYSSL